MYSAADAQRLINSAGLSRIFESIQAKKDIQQLMLRSITNEERNALAKNILLDSLIARVIQSAQLYSFSFGNSDEAIRAIPPDAANGELALGERKSGINLFVINSPL